jgi:putative peptidoglycan lipid II flippase
MSVLVIVSRITGFFRTWGQAFALGTTLLSSCYTVANNLPNQLYELVIGGMLVTAFLPVYMNVKHKAGQEGANRYVSNLLSIVFVLMGACTVLCIAFAAQLVWVQSAGTDQSEMTDAVFLFRFFAVEILLYCLSSIASGVLNAERDFLWSNAAPIFNNFITIASFVLYVLLRDANPTMAMLLLALGNPLGVLVQVLMQVPSLRRHGVHLSLHIDLHDPALKETLAIGVPSLVVTVASFVTVSVMNTYALVAVPQQGSSIVYYARLWYTLPYSVLSIPITTAMFTELSSMFTKGDIKGFVHGIEAGASQILFTLVPFMLYLMVFSYPLMMLMKIGEFGADSASITANYLAVLALALPAYGLSTFFQKVFSSMRHMMMFATANVVAAVVQVVFTVTMTDVMGIDAVALGSALYAIVVDAVSIVLLRRHFHQIRFGHVVRACLRSAGLGLVGALVGALILKGLGLAFGPYTGLISTVVYLVVSGVPAVILTFGLAIRLHLPEAVFFQSALSRLTRRGKTSRKAT